jgi:hypothetical protein
MARPWPAASAPSCASPYASRANDVVEINDFNAIDKWVGKRL